MLNLATFRNERDEFIVRARALQVQAATSFAFVRRTPTIYEEAFHEVFEKLPVRQESRIALKKVPLQPGFAISGHDRIDKCIALSCDRFKDKLIVAIW